MDLVWTLLPLVAFLACPLLLVVLALGLRAMAGAAASMAYAEAALAANPRRIDALRRQLRGVQVEPAMPRAAEWGAPSGGAFALTLRSDQPRTEPAQAAVAGPTPLGSKRDLAAPSVTWR